MSSRREVRERVMQALYAYELGGGSDLHVIETILDPAFVSDAANLEFAKLLFKKALSSTSEHDSLIAQHAQNWDVTRIALVDRLLLRIALTEILYFEDIPPKVTINEAIEVAKKYSTPRSGQFINGILDASLIALHADNRVKKKGRGLVGIESIENRTSSGEGS
ncbi:MAG: transcription antitermination factor NusB [Rhodothermales bacterium]|nr:transcription antitermination factor NusB [Rhodothermales bacterium]